MGKDINPSFVEYFAAYLKKLLNKPAGTITAKDFQDHVTTAANVYLKQHYNADPTDIRAAIAQSTPEAECAKAIKARANYNIGDDKRITFYETQTDIGNVPPKVGEATLATAKEKHREITNWATKTNMLLYDEEVRKKRQLQVVLEPYSAVYCGECWICNTDVMSFTGESIELHARTAGARPALEYGTTPCGDCEHVSAIMASYIAGMLTSSGFANVYWASYYVACVECNRRKSNYIGVKLNATTGWQVDDNGVDAIVDAIFPNAIIEPHASEYNPIRNALTEKYNKMSPEEKKAFRGKVSDNIKDGTQTWREAANKNMNKATATTKHIKMSFNVSKIIVAITGHLNVITGPLEKRAKKVAKAKRQAVKPTTTGKRKEVEDAEQQQGKKRRGGNPDEMENSDDKDHNPPILQWYNFIKEVEFDDEDDEDDENNETYAARILKYRDLVVDVCNTYGRLLFKQYESAPMIFNELMDNLSNSMYDILDPTNKDLPKLTDKILDDLATKFAVTGEKDPTLVTEEGAANLEPGSPAKVGSESQQSQDPANTGPAIITPAKKTDLFPRMVTRDTGKQGESAKTFGQDVAEAGSGTSEGEERGGSRLNKGRSKNNSQTHKQKNRTKRVSYIKHKQTRKNHHSRKTK